MDNTTRLSKEDIAKDPVAHISYLKKHPSVPLFSQILEICADGNNWTDLRDAGLIPVFKELAKEPIKSEMVSCLRAFAQCGQLILQTADQTSKAQSNSITLIFDAAKDICRYALAALYPNVFRGTEQEEYRLAVQQFLSTLARLQELDCKHPDLDINELDEDQLEDGCGELLFMYLVVGSPINVLVLYAWLYAPTNQTRQECHLFRQKYDGGGVFDGDVDQGLGNLMERFGADSCLTQAQNMIKNDGVIDDMLWEALRVISDIVEKQPATKLVAGLETDLATALQRQIEFGDDKHTWRVGAMANNVLDARLKQAESVSTVLAKLLKEHHGATTMAHMVAAAALTPTLNFINGAEIPIFLLDQLVEAIRTNKGSEIACLLVYCSQDYLRPVWLQTFTTLRTIDSSKYNHVPKLTRKWAVLGAAFRLDERVVVGCFWHKCKVYDTEADNSKQMYKCTGCKRAQYCGALCQQSDWKEGGHKEICQISSWATAI